MDHEVYRARSQMDGGVGGGGVGMVEVGWGWWRWGGALSARPTLGALDGGGGGVPMSHVDFKNW